jgi:hypothetical protein
MDTTTDAFGILMDKWLSDAAFRETLRADPEGAVHGLGLELSPEQWVALRRQLALPDEQLQARISKGFVMN